MYYLSIINGKIGFKVADIHNILESDVPISDEIYSRFFSEQSAGKQFNILNINGTTFEEIFQEYIPAPLPVEKTQVEILQETLDTLILSML